MVYFDLILWALAVILLFVIISRLIKQVFKKGASTKSRLLIFGSSLLFIALCYLPLKIVPNTLFSTSFNSLEERLDFEIEHQKYDKASRTVGEILKKDSLNLERHFEYVKRFKQHVRHITINIHKNSFIDHYISKEIINYYSGFTLSAVEQNRDIGHLFKAIHYTNLEINSSIIRDELDSIKNKSIRYYNYANAEAVMLERIYSKLKDAEKSYIKSLVKNDCNSESYQGLVHIYYLLDAKNKLDSLLYDETKSSFIDSDLKRVIYFNKIDIINYWRNIFDNKVGSANMIGFVAAFFILILWVFFFRQMDIYEPEKWHHIVMVILLSFITIYLIYPIHDFIWYKLNYYRPSHPVSDLTYITIVVGMTEEFVKILPVLIILKFTKAINEPFDYILYASLSGLGFACIENLSYFELGSLSNIHTRGILTSIGHASLSATVGYGLMLGRYRKTYNKYLVFVLFFLIASILHGLYDFWLMNWWAVNYWWGSMIVFIILVHLWAYYANNTINVSNFYDPKIQLNSNRINYFLIFSLVGIVMVSYILNSFVYGHNHGELLIKSAFFEYVFYILYIPLALSSIKVSHGYIAPISLPFRFLFPKKISKDLSGLEIELRTSLKFELKEEYKHIEDSLNTKATLIKRQVIDDNLESYLVQLPVSIEIDGFHHDFIVIIPEWDDYKLNHTKRVLVRILTIPSGFNSSSTFLNTSDFNFIGRAFSLNSKENNKI